MKITVTCMLLYLLSALVEVHPQTAPYIRFMGTNLPNHSYIDLSLVGESGDGVECHTDLSTCCSGSVGPDRGNWYHPNGRRLPFSTNHDRQVIGEFQSRLTKRVDVRRRGSSDLTEGIYCCNIETNAFNNISGYETLYAGLYISGGDISIPAGMHLTVKYGLNGESPQFTLTCISTGGPATTVTWNRDSVELMGGKTVLDNTETAQYTHTLTVTGRLPGQYQCSVSNNKPSQDSATLSVQAATAPTNLIAFQDGPTSIRVSWAPPTPLGGTRGYRIYYSGGSSGSVNVSGGSTDTYLLTGLVNGASYTISIIGTSEHFPSGQVDYPSTIPLIPGIPIVVVSSITATTISLSWSVPSGSVVVSYAVMWERDTRGECFDKDIGSSTKTDDCTSYNITGLEEDSSYIITVMATNAAGSTISDPVSGITGKAVPSAPPISVIASDVTSSSITVQWGAVDCIHRNGNITGYTMKYESQVHESIQTVSVSGETRTEATLSGLTKNTYYSIAVAAVNTVGIGKYSNQIMIKTNGDSSQSIRSCNNAGKLGSGIVGGFVGGVLLTIVIGTAIQVMFVRRVRTAASMRCSLSKAAKEEKRHIPTSNNEAYGQVKMDKGDTGYEMCDTSSGAARAAQESTYETVTST